MGNYSNIPIGLRIPTQIPLNAKENIADEATLKDLGINDNLAFTYEKGLIIYCKLEGTRYEWREVLSGEELTGLRDTDYIYPNGVITNDVDYSNKKYNFFTIENNTSNIFIEEGDNIVIDGNGSNITPYIISGLSSPFNSVNNSYFPRNRNESQFGDIGQFSYDFSFAEIGANGEPEGQIGQNGVQPDELYGSLGNLTYTFGYNLSAQGYNDSLFGRYNHSGLQSEYSTILGRNNYNNSKNSLLSGSYNKIIYNILGNSTVFGQGNIINGAAGLTSGVSLLNKSFGTTVLGQANTDYTDTSEDINEALSPILIVGNGNIATPDGIWTSTLRSDALKLLKNGLLTLPSVTNDLIENDVTGKAVVTKEYLETVFPNTPDGSETKIIPGTNIGITGNGTTITPYVISSNNDDISQYTNEMAQDAVGSILQNSDTIEFVYDDDNNTIHANLKGEAYRFITKTGFTLVDNVITINPLNVWLINNIEYSNPLSIELTIPYSTSGNQRIIYIVPNNTNSFDIISGEESVSTPGAPTLEFPDLYLTFYLVTDGTVGETVLPNYNDLFLKRYKLTYKTSQSDFNLEPGEDDYNVIFTGTTNSSINIFPNGSYGKYIRNGAIYPFKNMGTGVVSIWSGIGVTVNAPNGLILNPNHQCYIIKDDWNEWTVINPPNLTGYELRANKQNDLTPDGTGTKYPSVDAVNTIDLQKVVDVNGYAEKGNNYIDILGEKSGNHSVEVYVEDFNNTYLNSSLRVSTEGFSASSIGINKSADFVLNNGFFITEIENLTSKSTTLKIETPVESAILNFPAKTVAGTYTLATTDEVESVDLQKVIDVGGVASKDSSSVSLLSDDGIGGYLHELASTNEDSTSIIKNTGYEVYINNTITDKSATLSLSGGDIQIAKTKTDSATSTIVKILEPIENTTLNFPAKTIPGDYTLATTDEISTLDSNVVHKTGDETITGSKTFQTDTSSASITILNSSTTPHPAQKIYNTGSGNGLEIDFTTGTGDAIAVFNNGNKTLSLSREGNISSNSNYIKSSLKLLNSDADLYGDISLNLDRYLFNNKSGNLQFLTQNSGFVTYKSPTISGTFSNANLTESRTFTLPDATGTIPIISQTITNGVTDKSPSEDAVFDALGLKVSLSGNQTITGVTTLVGVSGSSASLDVKNGNANGSILIGADVNAITRTNGVRKLARFTTPSFSDVTKNHQIFAADFDDATSSKIYFGGTTGSTQLGCTEINFVTVTANGNTGGNTAMQVKSSGAVTINTTTDDGIANNKLQVNGNITASVATLSNQVVIKSQLDAVRPYKVYTALLTQVGTDAPTAIVLENTIGAIVWSRTVIGGYFATLSGAFTTDKTSVLITNGSANSTYIHGAQVSTSNVNVITLADGQIDKATIEIRVYK